GQNWDLILTFSTRGISRSKRRRLKSLDTFCSSCVDRASRIVAPSARTVVIPETWLTGEPENRSEFGRFASNGSPAAKNHRRLAQRSPRVKIAIWCRVVHLPDFGALVRAVMCRAT